MHPHGTRITIVLEACGEPGDPEPMWVVRSPELRGLNTEGATLALALEMTADALRTLGLNAAVEVTQREGK